MNVLAECDKAGVAEAAKAWIDTKNDSGANMAASEALIKLLEDTAFDKDCCKAAAEAILKDQDYLNKKSIWIFGGDGWAYDIGFGGLDHVLAQNQNVNILVFDTEGLFQHGRPGV